MLTAICNFIIRSLGGFTHEQYSDLEQQMMATKKIAENLIWNSMNQPEKVRGTAKALFLSMGYPHDFACEKAKGYADTIHNRRGK